MGSRVRDFCTHQLAKGIRSKKKKKEIISFMMIQRGKILSMLNLKAKHMEISKARIPPFIFL